MAGEVAEEVDGGCATVLEVVEGEQDGSGQRQPSQGGGDGVVGLPALELDVGGQAGHGR